MQQPEDDRGDGDREDRDPRQVEVPGGVGGGLQGRRRPQRQRDRRQRQRHVDEEDEAPVDRGEEAAQVWQD